MLQKVAIVSTQVLTIDTETYRDAWVAQCNALAAGAVPADFAIAQIRQSYDSGVAATSTASTSPATTATAPASPAATVTVTATA